MLVLVFCTILRERCNFFGSDELRQKVLHREGRVVVTHKLFLQRTGSSFTEVKHHLPTAEAHVSPVDRGIDEAARAASIDEELSQQALRRQRTAAAIEGYPSTNYASLPSWFNSKERKMQLEWPPGNTVFGEVQPGPRGYLMVQWPDGSVYESDISNLALSAQIEVMKKPAAAVRKRPAAACAPSANELEEPEVLLAEGDTLQPPAAAAWTIEGEMADCS